MPYISPETVKERRNLLKKEFPEFKFCTDNAAMIAITGYIKLKNNYPFSKDIYPDPNLNF